MIETYLSAAVHNEAVVAAFALAAIYYAVRFFFFDNKTPTVGEYFKLPPSPKKGESSTGSVLAANYARLKNSLWTLEQPRAPTIILPVKYVNELRSLPEEQISFLESIRSRFMPEYSLIGLKAHGGDDEVFKKTISHNLTRHLSSVMGDIDDETTFAYGKVLGPCDDWTEINPLSAMTNIVAYVSGRVFAGPELNRHPDYLRAIIMFTIECFNSAIAIRKYPAWLRPLAKYWVSETRTVRASLRKMKNVMAPVIEKRRVALSEGTAANNMTTWNLQASTESQRQDTGLQAHIQLVTSMAAIHTTSITSTHVMWDLAARPEYIPILREELDEVLASEPEPYLSKTAMLKLKKMDSFLKECARYNGFGALTFQRKVMSDITLHDGKVLPAGSYIAVAGAQTHLDAENFENPDVFDGMRFAKLREQDGAGTKHQMVETGVGKDQMIVFGHGMHACPGRFFAVNEIKVMVSYLLRNYDIKLKEGESRPANLKTETGEIPDRDATLLIRRRC